MSTLAARKLQLVIVDDDPSIVRLAERLIQKSLGDKLEIHTFTAAAEASGWIDRHCCDLLISDIEMPELNGLEMLRFAKQRNAWTQVIFMTAHSSWERVASAIELGASNYLLKPLDHREIVEVVEQEYIRCARWQKVVKGTFARQQPA